MKKGNLTKIILGIAILILGFLLLFGSTYLYDYFEGHKGREIIIVMFDFILACGSLIGGIALIIFGADNSD